MREQEELVATVDSEKAAFENDDGTRVAVINAKANGQAVTLRGPCREGELGRGLEFRFIGRWVNHPKYGRQFVFSSFVLEEPAHEEAVLAYLQQCRGIGPSTAALLWQKYGADAVRKLREEPEAACAGIPRFTVGMARAAAETLQALKATERTKIELLALLKGRGFPKRTVDRAIERWGARAPELIRRNPFKLLALRGCGFLLCDRMWLDLGLPPDRLKRQALCAWYAVASDTDGHTWLPESKATAAISGKVAGTSLRTKRAIELARRAGLLVVKEDRGSVWVADRRKARDEEWLADGLAATLRGDPDWPAVRLIDGLSKHQRDELAKALQGRIGILVGSPGTGKTATAARLMQWFASHGLLHQVAACAPTGKAAIRLQGFLQSFGVSKEVTTIHRLLGVRAKVDGGFEFQHGLYDPLPHRWIIVDEASMCDTWLLGKLVEAVPSRGHLLLVGDTNQLAPVGHGAPLRDMIAAGLPCGELTEIHRNAGRIVRACAELRTRHTFDCPGRFDVKNGENLALFPAANADATIERMRQFLEVIRAKGYDPIWDVQVICAVNEKSPLSRKRLNKLLQETLNGGGDRIGSNPFRVGDKLIFLKNGTVPLAAKGEGEDAAFVANGEQGEVLDVEPLRTMVRLESPARLVIVPHGKISEEDSDDEMKVDLAYAITGHKAQGSSWPFVVVLLDEYPGAQMLMTRNWIYTAVSRAEVACAVIGKRSVLEAACRQDGLQRKTFLAEMLREDADWE